MSDLETTAHEAVTSVQPLVEALDEAQRECQQAIRTIQGLGERLAADRHALDEAVAALEQGAEQDERVLAAETSTASASLARVGEAVHAALGAWQGVFHEEDQALAGGASLVSGLGARVKEMAEKAEAATHDVLEWTASVGQQLEHAVQALEEVVHQLTSMLAEWQQETESTITRLVEFLEKDCEALLAAREADWKSKTPQLHDLLDHAFEGMATHGHEVAAYVVEKWGQLMAAQLESTRAKASSLDEALSSLGQAAQNYAGELQAASDMVGEQQRQAAQGASKLEQTLLETRGRWATFGITG